MRGFRPGDLFFLVVCFDVGVVVFLVFEIRRKNEQKEKREEPGKKSFIWVLHRKGEKKKRE